MARETKTITYKSGEKDFHLLFTQLAPSKSLIFMMYLGKLLGGSAGKIVGSFQGSSIKDIAGMKDEDINLEKIGDAIFGLFERMDDDEVIKKLNLLFSSVSLDGQNLDVDHLMFQGEPLLIFKVAKEAIGVNYASFLDGNNGILSKLVNSVKMLKRSNDLPPTPM